MVVVVDSLKEEEDMVATLATVVDLLALARVDKLASRAVVWDTSRVRLTRPPLPTAPSNSSR